jgi:alkyl hydroperoxide reductase subunit AhpC/predicted Ser/Thr protein kinase
MVLVGSLAPDFSLVCTRRSGNGRDRASLADYRGRWLVLLFYPRDFSLICPTELTALSARIGEFKEKGAEILGVSTDPVERHEEWIATPRGQGGLGGLNFPLASDSDGTVARAYGVYLDYQRAALRGLFIIDPNGVLQYEVVHNLSVGRRAEEVLRVLDGLQSGGMCPEGWARGEPTLDAARAVGPGSIVSNFRIEQEVGSGTFGVVYRARDLTLDRMVALKIIRQGARGTPAALLAEARSAAALNHPNVCTIYSADAGDGVPVIAMEFVAGRPLSRLIEKAALPGRQAVSFGRQIASGMAHAHAAGVVHGDLKPENILVSDNGWVKVMDFGLARRAQVKLDETLALGADSDGGLTGTPNYMSPEQAGGEPASAATDVYALGVMFFEMVTGRRPYTAKNLLALLKLIASIDAAALAQQVPEPFRPLLRRALERSPQERASMEEIAAAMAELEARHN